MSTPPCHCGIPAITKSGKYGLFHGCSRYKKVDGKQVSGCNFIVNVPNLVNRESKEKDQVIQHLLNTIDQERKENKQLRDFHVELLKLLNSQSTSPPPPGLQNAEREPVKELVEKLKATKRKLKETQTELKLHQGNPRKKKRQEKEKDQKQKDPQTVIVEGNRKWDHSSLKEKIKNKLFLSPAVGVLKSRDCYRITFKETQAGKIKTHCLPKWIKTQKEAQDELKNFISTAINPLTGCLL
jgi:hypothetical protein